MSYLTLLFNVLSIWRLLGIHPKISANLLSLQRYCQKVFCSRTGPGDEDLRKLFDVLFVADHIAFDPLEPEFFVGFRNPTLGTALMPVSKSPADENHSPVLLQNNIGLPRQFRAVEGVAETSLVQGFTQKYLGLCVL